MAANNRLDSLETTINKVKVWDVPTRLFHWSVVLLVLTSWLAADNGRMELHLWSGLTLLTLLVFRIIWGFWGSTTARFSSFVTCPRTTMNYFRAMSLNRKPLYVGHNPAGGWMVLLLLTLLVLQVTTGLFANDDVYFNGPLAISISKTLSDRLTALHATVFNIILLFIWIHIVAVFFYLCVKSENLVWPMITGKKDVLQVPLNIQLKFSNTLLALFLLGLTALVIWLLLG